MRLEQVTFGNSLETLDLFRSSASEVNPGEAEAIAGLVKGSLIPNLALTASDRALPFRIFGSR